MITARASKPKSVRPYSYVITYPTLCGFKGTLIRLGSIVKENQLIVSKANAWKFNRVDYTLK